MTATPPCYVIDMQRPSAIAAHAGRTVLTASLIPTAIFYTVMSTVNLSMAVVAAVTWYYSLLLLRVIRRRPVIGAALLGTGLITARAVVVFWTGSAYLYFLQPIAGTVATATSFAITALAGRPLLERLAADFVPMPPALTERLRAARFFRYTSVLWTLTYVLNAVGTIWLLSTSSLGAFLLIKTLMSPLLTATTVTITYLLFRRLMRRDGISLRWPVRTASRTAPVAA